MLCYFVCFTILAFVNEEDREKRLASLFSDEENATSMSLLVNLYTFAFNFGVCVLLIKEDIENKLCFFHFNFSLVCL